MVRTLFILTAATFFLSCHSRQREEALNVREARLQQWEGQLQLREQALTQREDELASKARSADSLSRDSAMLYEPRLVGRWSVKMTCSETTCSGSAVGDTKSESWEFSYTEDGLTAQVIEKGKVARLYHGQNTVNGIMLTEDFANTATKPRTRITAHLNLTKDNIMEGQREIVRENDCRIVYALQLDKQ